MQQRIYAAVITVLSLVAILLATADWADGYRADIPAVWTGLGTGYFSYDTSTDFTKVEFFSATPLGLCIIAFCVLSMLTALIMWFPALDGAATPMRWLSALLALVAAAVPGTVLIHPSVFLGSAFDELGMQAVARDPQYRGFIRDEILEQSTLITLIVVLLLTSAVCVATAVHLKRVPTVTSTDPPESETPRSEQPT